MKKQIGLDIGNRHTKISVGGETFSFPSNVTKGKRKQQFGSSDVHELLWNNVYYLVGDETNGAPLKGDEKYSFEEYQVLVLAAIGLCDNSKDTEIDADLMIGTPVKNYESLAKPSKASIKELDGQQIVINGVNKTININNLEVIPQSAIALSNNKNIEFPCMFVDFGGGTLDISYWNKDKNNVQYMVMKNSYEEYGFDLVLKSIADALSTDTKIKSKLKWFEMEKYIYNKEIKTSTGKHDVTKLKDDTLSAYSSDVFNTLLQDGFNIAVLEKLYLLGGCATLLKDYLVEYCESINFEIDFDVEDEPQFTNSNLFEELAERVFKKKGGTKVNG